MIEQGQRNVGEITAALHSKLALPRDHLTDRQAGSRVDAPFQE